MDTQFSSPGSANRFNFSKLAEEKRGGPSPQEPLLAYFRQFLDEKTSLDDLKALLRILDDGRHDGFEMSDRILDKLPRIQMSVKRLTKGSKAGLRTDIQALIAQKKQSGE